MKKKLLSAILCSAMIAGTLAGCGGSTDDGGAAPAPAEEPAAEEEAPAADSASEEEAPAAASDGEAVTLTV